MVALQSAGSSNNIMLALAQASRRTGTDFDYLLRTAQRESGLKTQAKAKSSSAVGLFQFVEQTWLELAQKYGAEAGMGALSAQITTTPQGRHEVSDPAAKQEILALRHDASLSAFMAGKMTQESKLRLEKALGRSLKDNELYTAHFLGVSGAVKLLKAAPRTPSAPAADLFPAAARTNRRLFYDDAGAPKSVAQLYRSLTKTAQSAHASKAPASAPVPVLSPVLSGASVNPDRQTRGASIPASQDFRPRPLAPRPARRAELANIFNSRIRLSAPILDILSALDMKSEGKKRAVPTAIFR